MQLYIPLKALPIPADLSTGIHQHLSNAKRHERSLGVEGRGVSAVPFTPDSVDRMHLPDSQCGFLRDVSSIWAQADGRYKSSHLRHLQPTPRVLAILDTQREPSRSLHVHHRPHLPCNLLAFSSLPS